MKLLDFYKEIKKNNKFYVWDIAMAFDVFNSVDCFVDNPTDEVYEVLYNVCARAYIKSEDISLPIIANRIADGYSNGEFTLEELQNMEPYQILDLVDIW